MLTTEKLSTVYKFQPNEYLLGTTNSTYSWEYDYSAILASLVVNTQYGNVKLIFTHHKVKSGLGAGEWYSYHSCYNVGTMNKLNKGEIKKLLSEKKNYYPFRKNGWSNSDCKLSEMSMMQLFESNLKIQRLLKINKLMQCSK